MEGSKTDHDIRDSLIKPLPSQEKFLDAMYDYEYLLFGGAAGPGKSYIIRWALLEFLLECFGSLGLTGVSVGLFCEDYPTLKDRHISKIKREFPLWLGEVKDTKEDGLHFGLWDKFGGGKMLLRNLDEPSKYASAEFAAIGVDELTKNDRQTFDDLRFRKRWPGIEHSPFIAASNPGSKGHGWVKKLFIDRNFSGDDSELDPRKFCFIPAKAGENPYLPQSYWDTLNSLPPKMRKAMLDGNWDLFSGQFFEEWDRSLHVCEPFGIPSHWKKVIGIDYGYERPSATGWWAIDPEGGWWLYRELYQTHLTYPTLAHEICERTPLGENVDLAIADPAIWGDRERHKETLGQTGGEIMLEILDERVIELVKGNHNRIQGWQLIRDLLKQTDLPDGRKGTKLHVFSTCREFIRTFPSLVHDEIKAEDLDTDGEDHHADALRYAVNTRFDHARKIERISQYGYAMGEIPSNAGYGF